MTKKLIGLALLLSLASASMAQVGAVNAPHDQKGMPVDPLWGGYNYVLVSNTIAETVICTGRCLFAGLYMSTGANTNAVALRDTSVANGSGARFFPRRRFELDSTSAIQQVNRPIRVSNGISAQMEAAGADIVVLYLDLD